MTSHRGTRNPPSALGITAIAFVVFVVALAPRGAASQPAEESLSPGGRDYVGTRWVLSRRLWDWLQNEEEGEGVVDGERHEQPTTYPGGVMERNLRSPSPVRRNSGMHNIFRLDKRRTLGGKVLGGYSGDGDGAYRVDRRDGVGMHGIFRLDKRAPVTAATGERSARAGAGGHMHSVFRLDRRSAGAGAGSASNMHDIFRLDRR